MANPVKLKLWSTTVVVTLAAGFRQFDWRLDDAARVMGASPARRIATIVLPLFDPP